MLKNTHPDSFEIPKTSAKTVYVTPCTRQYSHAANCLSSDVGPGTKLAGVKTIPSHKILSRWLNVMLFMRIFSKNSSVTFLVIELSLLLLSDVLVSSGFTRFSIFIPQNSHYSSNEVDDVFIIFLFHEMSCSFQQTFMEVSPLSFSLSRYQKKEIIHTSAYCSHTLFLT